MTEDNNKNGYLKVDKYKQDLIDKLALHYKEIIKL